MTKDFISDEEMEALEREGKVQAPATPTPTEEPPEFLSDEEMAQLESKPERSAMDVVRDNLDAVNLLKNAGAGVMKASEAIDSVTGAPARKAITEAVSGQKLEKAPTGKEQAEMLGFSPEDSAIGLSPAGVMGFGLEVIQDPLLLAGPALRGIRYLGRLGKYLGPSDTAARDAARAAEDVLSSPASAPRRGTPVKTLEELRDWEPRGRQSELPGKARLRGIVDSNNLHTPPLKYHFDMMEDPKAMKRMKLEFENLPEGDAIKIAQYNQAMVNESRAKIRDSIDLLVPYSKEELANGVVKRPKPLSDSGSDFITEVRNRYHAEKDAVSPIFDELRQSPPISREEGMTLIEKLGEKTKIGQLLDVKDGAYSLRKNSPRTGLSDEEYKVISRVIEDLSDGATFRELQAIREFMRKHIDPINPGATSEIGKVRKAILEEMEGLSSKLGLEASQVFRRYAINERNFENVERILGGKLEGFEKVFAANPDKVVDRIFSNPNYVDVIRSYLGDDAVQNLIASKVFDGFEKAMDSARGFQPHTFRNWIRKNRVFLTRYVDPAIAKQLSDMADYGYYGKRFMDDVNPSGTAASLAKAMADGSITEDLIRRGVRGTVGERVTTGMKARRKQREAVEFFRQAIGEDIPPRSSPAGMTARGAARMAGDTIDYSTQQTFRDGGMLDRRVPEGAVFLQNLINQSIGRSETPIEKAKRINEERRMQKGQ